MIIACITLNSSLVGLCAQILFAFLRSHLFDHEHARTQLDDWIQIHRTEYPQQQPQQSCATEQVQHNGTHCLLVLCAAAVRVTKCVLVCVKVFGDCQLQYAAMCDF